MGDQEESASIDPMADLSASLGSSFAVSKNPNDTNQQHPRFSQYKNQGLTSKHSQEKRRTSLLELQKKRRSDFLNVARDLVQGKTEEYDDDEEAWLGGDEMDVTEEKPPRFINMRRQYKNQLMLSEWMVDVPENLSTDWLMVPAPVGKRCFVLAGNGVTKLYHRSGYVIKTFPSYLPGGLRNDLRPRCSILDCIYVEGEQTLYVLDLMMWKDYSYYECSSDLRFYMATAKLCEETEGIQERNKRNPLAFKCLPFVECDRQSLSTFLQNPLPFNQQLDGLLFYHKSAQYLPGRTPLVTWLKGYMVPELLNIEVSKELKDQAPSDYVNMTKDIENYNEKSKKLAEQRREKREEKRKKRIEKENGNINMQDQENKEEIVMEEENNEDEQEVEMDK